MSIIKEDKEEGRGQAVGEETAELGLWRKKTIAQTTPFKYVRKHVGLVILQQFKITRRGNYPIQGSICVIWTFKEIKVDWFH